MTKLNIAIQPDPPTFDPESYSFQSWLREQFELIRQALDDPSEQVTTGTTDGSGDLLVTHDLGIAPSFVISSFHGTTFYHGQMHTPTTTTFKLRVLNAAGAAVAATAVTASWRAKV